MLQAVDERRELDEDVYEWLLLRRLALVPSRRMLSITQKKFVWGRWEYVEEGSAKKSNTPSKRIAEHQAADIKSLVPFDWKSDIDSDGAFFHVVVSQYYQ